MLIYTTAVYLNQDGIVLVVSINPGTTPAILTSLASTQISAIKHMYKEEERYISSGLTTIKPLRDMQW